MKTRVLEFFKNTVFAVFANVSRILTTLLLTLLLPKLMTVEDYSYWQLYGFYSIYLAYSSLGWCEGTYLKYAGKKYEELDGSLMSSQFWGLCIYEAFFCSLFFIIFSPFFNETNKVIVLGMALLYTWIQIIRFQLQTILQASNRISDYAKIYSGERVINFILVIGCMTLGVRQFWWVAGMEIISNVCMTAYALFLCRSLIFVRPAGISDSVAEMKELLQMGCKLALAGFANQLIIGIVRQGIESKWGTIVFGKISLSFSMSNMVITCITAVSIVLFPVLRNCEISKLKKLYHPARMSMTVPLFALLLLYIPVKLILSVWLPQYKESLQYLGILFPLCVYETRNTVLTWTYLKTIWREADIMKANIIMVGASMGMTGFSVYILGRLEFAVISIIILYVIKGIYTEYLLGKQMDIFSVEDTILEGILTVVFIVCGWYLNGIEAFIGYMAAYVLYVLVKRRDIEESVGKMRELLKTE